MAQRLEVPLKYAFIQVYLINGGCSLDSLSGNALIFNRINWSRRIVRWFFSRPLSASGGGSGFFAAGHGATAIENLAFTHHHFPGNGGGDGGCFFYKNRLGYNFASNLAKICTIPEWITFPGFSNSYLKGFQSCTAKNSVQLFLLSRPVMMP